MSRKIKVGTVKQDDVGMEVVRHTHKVVQIDAEWTVWNERGFEWWPHDFSQRIWSDPPVRQLDEDVFMVHSEITVRRDVPDKPALYADLATINFAVGTTLIYDPESGDIRLHLAWRTRRELAEWSCHVFSYMAVVQLALAEHLVRALPGMGIRKGKSPQSPHPSSGLRTVPDEMVSCLPVVYLMHQHPIYLQEHLEMIRASGGLPSILTTVDTNQLTAEFPVGAPSGMFRATFGPEGKPHTGLFQLKIEDHAMLKGGAWTLLHLPHHVDGDEALRLANSMNLVEATEFSGLHLLGGWTVGPHGLMYRTFLPDALGNGTHGEQVLQNFCMEDAGRLQWVLKRFELPALPLLDETDEQVLLKLLAAKEKRQSLAN